MAELAISNLIKIILGVIVFVMVIVAVAFFFKNQGDFFGGLPTNPSTERESVGGVANQEVLCSSCGDNGNGICMRSECQLISDERIFRELDGCEIKETTGILNWVGKIMTRNSKEKVICNDVP